MPGKSCFYGKVHASSIDTRCVSSLLMDLLLQECERNLSLII